MDENINVHGASLRVALEMQLEDLNSLLFSSKGKQRQGEIPDFELALDSYKVEIESQLMLLGDREMCHSIASAVRLDANIIKEFVAQEEEASSDRKLALKSSNGVIPVDSEPNTARKEPGLEEDLLNKLETIYVSPPDLDEDSSRQAGSSSWTAAQKQPHTIYRSCTACTEDYPVHNIASCSQCPHEYCRGCLRRLFSDSLTDESLFPPRCCGSPIDIGDVLEFLPPRLVGEFKAKSLELGTPNRTYCHKPTCSLFIPPPAISEDIGTCIGCHHETCTICKGPAHSGRDCPDDAGTQALLEVAAENGWQRCYQCHRMVELNFGCYHISKSTRPKKEMPARTEVSIACICKAQFCYLCGLCWKQCACRQWDDDRLVTRAQDIVARGVGARRLDEVQRAALVERERQNLLQNHECTHGSWGYRSGGHRCEECRHTLPNYIYECRQCHIMVCRRCRYNRL